MKLSDFGEPGSRRRNLARRDWQKEEKEEKENSMEKGFGFINTTPHAVTFLCEDGTEFTVPPCGVLINARAVEEEAGEIWADEGKKKIKIVRTKFIPDPESEQALKRIEDTQNGIIFGSIISAQAFPGRIFGLIAAPGFERVPVNEKRMRPDKFTVF